MKHLAIALLCALPLRVSAEPVTTFQATTDDLRQRLAIFEKVYFTLVDHNPLVMSVETLAGRSGPFVITADRDFVRSLNAQELEAAIAHELGHVWIYTHHPYLQTEKAANDVAMRVISVEVLAPVYEKVWDRLGSRGNLSEYISFDGKPGGQ